MSRVVTVALTVGDLAEVTYDGGFPDESVGGVRLHASAIPADTFTPTAVQATSMCPRSVAASARCV